LIKAPQTDLGTSPLQIPLVPCASHSPSTDHHALYSHPSVSRDIGSRIISSSDAQIHNIKWCSKPGVEVHVGNLNTWEVEAGGS
jgi:hypothetical protein